MHLINETQTEILLALARFKFLTTSQLHKIIRKELAWLRKQILYLTERERSLVEKITFGFHPRVGKLENVFFLTKLGKHTLIEVLQMEEDTVRMPVGNSSLFYKDYTHRKNTIDFHIQLYHWTQESGIELDFFDTYFDKSGNNRKDKNLRAKTKIDLDTDNYIIPDGAFTLSTEGGKFLYLFEMYDGKDTKRVVGQLKKHAQAIAMGSPSIKYGFANKSNRVLSVFEHESIKDAVVGRLQREQVFRNMPNHFLFKSLAEMNAQRMHENWRNLKGEVVGFI